MGKTVKIKSTDLKDVVAQMGVLNKLKPGGDASTGCTLPWVRLSSVGLSTLRTHVDAAAKISDGKVRASEMEAAKIKDAEIRNSYCDKVVLSINSRGIRNKTTKYFSDIFKTEILPAINNFVTDCRDTFVLVLHFQKGMLKSAILKY